MKRGLKLGVWLFALAATAAVIWHLSGRAGAKIGERAKQAVAIDPDALSAKLIPADDLPPAGTRSLFDHLVAQNEVLPYPFEKLIELVRKQDPANQPLLVLMLPQGRSLLKASADYEHPRVLVAADFQAPGRNAALGLALRGQLFLGFVENAHEIEVISYNEAAGRFEFQLVQDYCDGCAPKLVYAKRAICTTCHQGGVPIFPQRPWNETNGQPQVAAKIAQARKAAGLNHERYLGQPVANPLSAPERFDQLTDIGAFIPVTQQAWLDGCGGTLAASKAQDVAAGPAMDDDTDARGIACRRQMLKLALLYLWSPGEFDERGREAQRLRELQAVSWPKGIAVPNNDLFNRDPLAESRGLRGWLSASFAALLPQRSREAEPKSNEDLAAFERLPKLPPELDQLTPRPPKRVLSANDIDGAFGLAALFTDSDFKSLEKGAKGEPNNLLAAVDQLEAKLFEPAPYSRVRTMQALLVALGGKTIPDYCCLDTAEMSPPIASGEPPVQFAAGSLLAPFAQYCFACHRGNPARRLDFMSGKTADEVLANLRQKSEIRDVLDWSRYRGTDKENKLMPPADSAQRRQLERALADNPKLLDEMRAALPGLFDF